MSYMRLRELRRERKLNQSAFAKIFGVSQNAVSCWETGERRPDFEMLCKIADFFGCSVDYLLGVSDGRAFSKKIPVLGYVRAGVPIEAIEDIIGYEEIPQNLASLGEYFGLKIRGDSMEPRMQEGATVIVKQQSSANNGDIVIAFIDGSDVTVKQFFKDDDTISLVPFNKSYETLKFSKKDAPVSILGKVVEMRVKF